MSADWPMVCLGNYCEKIGSGATPKGGKSVYLDVGETALIRSQNVYNEGFTASGLAFISEEAADKLRNVSIEPNDILLNITGDSVARVCMAPEEYLPARVNQHVAIIRPDNSRLDSRFVRYFLSSPEQQRLLLTIASSGATRNALTKSHIEQLEVPMPGLEIQQAIANQLETLDKKIKLNQQINQTLEQMAQAIFKSWFVDFEPVKAKMAALEAGGSEEDALIAAMQAISGKDQTQLDRFKTEQPEQYNELRTTAELFPAAMQDCEIGEIPEGWEIGFLNEIAEFTSNRVNVSDLNSGNYISTENMLENKKGVIEASSLPSSQSVPGFYPGDILVSNIRPYFKKIWLADRSGGRSPDVLGFKGIHPQTTEFLFNFLYQDRFFDFMMLTSKGAKMPRGDKKAIMNLKLPIPSLSLMEIFSSRVRSYHGSSKLLKEQSNTLAGIRDILLPRLLSGELNLEQVNQTMGIVQ